MTRGEIPHYTHSRIYDGIPFASFIVTVYDVVLIFTAVKKLKPYGSTPSPYNIIYLFSFF